ncbi:MAG TPA: hypothetical protein VGL92_11930, partial [Acidimicrobiia bacterium]
MAETVLNAPEVTDALERAADPTRARLILSRLAEAQPELAERLPEDRLLLSAVVALAGASRS